MENQTEDDILKRWQAEEVGRQRQHPKKRARRTIESAAQDVAPLWATKVIGLLSSATNMDDLQARLKVLAGGPSREQPATAKPSGSVNGARVSRTRVGAFESSPAPIDLDTDAEVPD